MAGTGVRKLGLTFFQSDEPGRPPSREKAKIIRDVDVNAGETADVICQMTMLIARTFFSQIGAGSLA